MAKDKKTLKIQCLRHWVNEADEGLLVSVNDDYDEIKAQVNSGISKLYKLNDGESWLVTRLETIGSRLELVGLCFEGKNFATWANVIISEARKAGIDCVRFHVKNEAVARLVRFVGAKKRETVYEVKI